MQTFAVLIFVSSSPAFSGSALLATPGTVVSQNPSRGIVVIILRELIRRVVF